MKVSACERRDTRDERRTKRTDFFSILIKAAADYTDCVFSTKEIF